MAAQGARVIDNTRNAYYSSAAPARAPYIEPRPDATQEPKPSEQVQLREQTSNPVSLLSVLGTIFAAFLMIFVVLAQINLNAIASETDKLDTVKIALSEQARKLEIEFENSIDIKEIERIARDGLGMSRPSQDLGATVINITVDNAQILEKESDNNAFSGFGSFISSLFDFFR